MYEFIRENFYFLVILFALSVVALVLIFSPSLENKPPVTIIIQCPTSAIVPLELPPMYEEVPEGYMLPYMGVSI